MGAESKIQWCNATFNHVRGCTKVSAGCAHCYADTQSKRNPLVLGVWGPNGTRVVAAESQWREPVKWNRLAAEGKLPDGSPNPDGHRPRVFCASLADVFEDWTGPMSASDGNVLARPHLDAESRWENWTTTDAESLRTDPQGWKPVTMGDVRARLFRLIHETPNLDWLLVTKRPENVARHLARYAERIDTYVAEAFSTVWGRRVWIGTSVENQAAADDRILHLLKTPAAVRFLSCEPLLGPLDLSRWLAYRTDEAGAVRYCPSGPPIRSLEDERPADWPPAIGWVIVGGESGAHARPCSIDAVRDLVKQCKAAGVPVFVKQLGAKPVGRSPTLSGPLDDPVVHDPDNVLRIRDPKGGEMSEWPADLQVRDFPTPAGRAA